MSPRGGWGFCQRECLPPREGGGDGVGGGEDAGGEEGEDANWTGVGVRRAKVVEVTWNTSKCCRYLLTASARPCLDFTRSWTLPSARGTWRGS